MKPRTMILIAAFIIGFLAYKMFAPKSKPNIPSSGTVAAVDNEAAETTLTNPDLPQDNSSSAEDLEATSKNEDVETVESESIHADPLEPTGEDRSTQAGIIKVKVPEEYENRPGIVTLATSDEVGPERERLDNVSQSFEEGRDAVQTFGDQLNALNGSYSGEIVREGRDSCPMTLVIDGLYVPKEGDKVSDFTGNFSVQYTCPGSNESKGQFHNQFGGHVRAIGGDKSKSLLLKDNSGNFFQLSFSPDFQRVSGFAYETPNGASPSLLGKLTASR